MFAHGELDTFLTLASQMKGQSKNGEAHNMFAQKKVQMLALKHQFEQHCRLH